MDTRVFSSSAEVSRDPTLLKKEMGLINKRTRVRIGGLRVVIRPIEVNLGFYKRYGCLVIVRALKRKRRRAGVDILIQNHYFYKPTPGLVDVAFLKSTRCQTRNARRTKLAEFKLSLDGDPTIFPIIGVVSKVRIRIAGEERLFTFVKGTIDPGHTVLDPFFD